MSWKDHITVDRTQLTIEDNIELELAHLSYEIPTALRRLREHAGMSQADVAEMLEMQQPAISRLERYSTTPPSLSKLVAYLHAVGAKLSLSFESKEAAYDLSYTSRLKTAASIVLTGITTSVQATDASVIHSQGEPVENRVRPDSSLAAEYSIAA